MGEEAHAPEAVGPVLARLGSVPGRVEPALEHAVRVLARVALPTVSLAKVGATRTRIVVLPRVTPAGLFTGMGVRTVSPVVRPASCTHPDLELVHAKVIARVRVNRVVGLVGVRIRIV